jgi:hypothetical protein
MSGSVLNIGAHRDEYIPGLTKLSLFPDAAKACGIDFNSLIEKLINLALG